MDLTKYLSREFLTALALMVAGTAALFIQPIPVSFTEWALACAGFYSAWASALTVQKIKAPTV